MAKKKSAPIEESVIEEVVVEETTPEVIEEPIEEVIEEVIEETNNGNQFVYAQLKAINKLNNPAKARRSAERVLRNRKR